jgi:CC2D2A N-terminal C2 domain
MQVPPVERLRRAKARAVTLQAALFINGVRVCSTASAKLSWPRYCVTFDHVALLRLVRRPSSAQVRQLNCLLYVYKFLTFGQYRETIHGIAPCSAAT